MRRESRFKLVSVALLLALVVSSETALAGDVGAKGAFEQALARGPVWATLAAFVGGLLVSLTPCVYPMIAITVSVFGARTAKSRASAAALSAVYVLGIAVMFTGLGVGAALSGSLFGSALSNRWVVAGIALLFLALSASMFGVFELALPPSAMQGLTRVGGIGYAGAFALGLASALVAAPCTGPVLAGILLWIATSHAIALGSLVMFTFALGLGVPFFVVGTFAVGLPKSGAWMLGVKWFFGVVLAVVALYFLRTAVPALDVLGAHGARWLPPLASGFALLGFALAWGHVRSERRGARYPHRSGWFKALSVPPTVAGGFALVAWCLVPPAELQWFPSEEQARQVAASERRPMIVDFGAAWCAACSELRSRTFADPAVRAEAARFVAVNVDATDDDNPNVDGTKKRYSVVGLPTVILLSSDGRERARFQEFVSPARFLDALRLVD
jgi:thiol:disulfide interchange protein DsbD